MISTELLQEFRTKKAETLTLAQSLITTPYEGVAFNIIDRLSENRQSLVLDSNGAWSGRLDMMGFDIAVDDATEVGIVDLLIEVASLYEEAVPEFSEEAEIGIQEKIGQYQDAQANYIAEHGDRLLGLLIQALNQTILDYQR